MEEINAAGKKQFDEWFKTEEGAKELDDAQYYGSTIRQSFDGVEYIYNPVMVQRVSMKNRAVRPCLMSILQMAPNTLTCIKITALRYRLRI